MPISVTNRFRQTFQVFFTARVFWILQRHDLFSRFILHRYRVGGLISAGSRMRRPWQCLCSLCIHTNRHDHTTIIIYRARDQCDEYSTSSSFSERFIRKTLPINYIIVTTHGTERASEQGTVSQTIRQTDSKLIRPTPSFIIIWSGISTLVASNAQ